MYIVERRNTFYVTAEKPESAALAALESRATNSVGSSIFDIWETNTADYFVVRFNPHFDPCDENSQEFEVVDRITRGAKQKLVEEMIYLAHCDDKNLRTICEMAAVNVKSNFDYIEWMKRANDETDTENDQRTSGRGEEER